MSAPFAVAPAPDPDAAEAARRLLTGRVDFLRGVVAMDGLPPADRVEVCFAGRSNVGKSTLINALTGRRALARASNTPGRTQEINFFTVADDRYLVDLPGYGFAKAPVAVVERWQALLRAYLAGRPSLRRAFLLIDARHGAKAVDEEMMALMDRAAVPFQAVLTKGRQAHRSRPRGGWGPRGSGTASCGVPGDRRDLGPDRRGDRRAPRGGGDARVASPPSSPRRGAPPSPAGADVVIWTATPWTIPSSRAARVLPVGSRAADEGTPGGHARRRRRGRAAPTRGHAPRSAALAPVSASPSLGTVPAPR